MRFVLFSDLHLDAPFGWEGPPMVVQRRRALARVLTRIMELADDASADAVLVGGDLYEHTLSGPDTGELLRAAFESIAPVPVFVSPGNHDWYGRESLYHSTQWSPNVHIFDDRSLRPVRLQDGLTLWGGSHLAPSRSTGFLDGFRCTEDGVQIALFHGSEASGMSNSPTADSNAPFSAEQVSESGLDHAFVGHYHEHHDAEHFTYSGNPDPLTFEELHEPGSGSRGAVVVQIQPDGRVERERRRVAVTEIHDLHVEVDVPYTTDGARSLVRRALEGLTGVAVVSLDGILRRDVGLDAFGDIEHSLDGVHIRYADPANRMPNNGM